MSEIKNGGLDQYGAEPFEHQQFGTAGIEWVKREYYQNCSVLHCVVQCSQSAAHLCEQFIQVKQIGFVTL